MHSIKRLPKSVHSTVRSSIVLFDLPRVLEELIYNCIDAASTKVDISINIRACYVKVSDDGHGITRDGLVILGEKYITSKVKSRAEIERGTSNMGFKGETIGSLSDISLVEIRTRARGWPNAYCKIIKGSKCIFLGIDDQRESVGTTVTVRDLFYNQPVRRKCMQSSSKKVLHSVKKCVLQIALMHPQVSFRVTDIESEDELLCTVPSSSPLPLISSGFGLDVSSCLHEIICSDKLYTLSGFISGPCDTSSKTLQYLYINSRFVSKGSIHNSINNLANRFQTDQIRDEYSKSQSRKRPKFEGYPAFLLNLSCPLSTYDLNFEPSKTIVEFKDLNVVLSLFERVIANLWKGLSLETCRVEDKSLSFEIGSPNKEASRRKKKTKVELSQSPILNNMVEEINHDIFYKTPIKESPLKVGRNYKKTKLVFEDDKPFLRSCSKERRNCIEREYFSDFENIGGDFCNFENSIFKDDWGDLKIFEEVKYNQWKFPEASRKDFGSPDKNWIFNSPCSFSKKSHDTRQINGFDFEDEDEIFESSMDIFKKSKLFEFSNDGNQFPELWDSPIPNKNSEFSILDSPVRIKSKSPLHESKLRKYPLYGDGKIITRRSHSAPPFRKEKFKFSSLNERLTAQNPSFHVTKTSPVEPEIQISQACCNPSETSKLNLNYNREKSTDEGKNGDDEFDQTGDELTKWRAVPVQSPPVKNHSSSSEDILSISSGILHLSSNSSSLIPQSIERECLENARVLLQLDNKFIPIVANHTLLILDQHAADERIRLEDLRRKVLSGEGCGVTRLDSEEELVLPEMGFQVLEKYSEHINKWGWIINTNQSNSSDPFTKNMSVLKRQASSITLVAVPCILGTNLTSKDLIEFLQQLVETDGSPSLPPSVIRILNSKACRGAIMFGDSLLPSECSLILEELKATSLCFQCAHGRPTTVPILNIKSLHEELAKIEMHNVGSSDTWHGFRHHKLSLERAQMRLDQAKM